MFFENVFMFFKNIKMFFRGLGGGRDFTDNHNSSDSRYIYMITEIFSYKIG